MEVAEPLDRARFTPRSRANTMPPAGSRWIAGYDYTFSYDAMGRFEKMFNTGGSQLFQYRYDAASNEVERDNIANSVNQIYSRDALNRMSERDVKLNTTVLSSE